MYLFLTVFVIFDQKIAILNDFRYLFKYLGGCFTYYFEGTY